MQFLNRLALEDRDRCLRLIATAAGVRSHHILHNWIRGVDMQQVLPHDALLAVWGDMGSGNLRFDVLSEHKAITTATADPAELLPRAQQLFSRWTKEQEQPCTMSAEVLSGTFGSTSFAGRSVLVHGLRDLRAGQDCCYIVVSQEQGHASHAADALAALLPYIDIGFRQAAALPRRAAPDYDRHRMPAEQITLPSTTARASNPMGMTERELQIMRWVEMGKTNYEIGSILSISAFTVKNHLQRIFKKLDVYSRAQAVSRFKDSMLYG